MERRQQLPLALALSAWLAVVSSVLAQDLHVGQPVPTSRCISIKQCFGILKRIQSYGQPLPPDFADHLRSLQCREDDVEVHLNCPYEDQLHPSGVEALSRERCGVFNSDRIAFGEEAKLGQFKWMALLKYDDAAAMFQCGGSLITNRYVMTAAHCITPQLIGVRLGEHNYDTAVDCQKRGTKEVCTTAEDFGIETIKAHKGYSRAKLIHDVALLKLDREVEFKWHIKPICLPMTQRSTWLHTTATNYLIAGWGITENGTQSYVLQTAPVSFTDRASCQATFRRIPLSESHICAGGDINPQDSCKGDSGGPLSMPNFFQKTVRMIQYGIVSFGVAKCGTPQALPGVYANVIHYMPWITSNLD